MRLRHARDVNDLDMHNNGHVNPVHNAQFETVRICLCCITAKPSSVEELKRGTIHCPTRLLELIKQGHRDVTGAQYLYTALGWRYSSSPRRKRREKKRGDTRVLVPVPDPSLLILFAVPHDLDTIWSQPDCTVSTSVPEVRLANVAFIEPHPLNGVRQLSRRRG